MTASDLSELPLQSLRCHLAARDFSCAELAEATIAAVERTNPALNAIIRFDADWVRAQAAEADRRLTAGERGPWLGIPVTAKDSIWIKDRPVANGSTLFADFIAPSDAIAVRRLRSAGAVLLGSTNCSEFACKGVTSNLLHGETRNPWDLSRTPGGSSGGAAAATAAGLGVLGLGTDAGGSVRRPASHTGLVGMKPTAGMIPHAGGFDEPVYGNSVIGLLTRRVADAISAMELLTQPDMSDPQSPAVPRFVPRSLDRPARIAYSPRLGLGFAVDAEVQQALQRAVAALRDAGHVVDDVDPPLQLDEGGKG